MTALKMIALIVAAVGISQLPAHGETMSVWGVPLGACTAQLRSTLGEPQSIVPNTGQPAAYTWTYNRNDSVFVLWIYHDCVSTIYLTGPGVMGSHAYAAGPDPLGITVGDAADDVFKKTGSLINVGNDGVRIDSATLVVRRLPLIYRYQVLAGYVNGEYITLMK